MVDSIHERLPELFLFVLGPDGVGGEYNIFEDLVVFVAEGIGEVKQFHEGFAEEVHHEEIGDEEDASDDPGDVGCESEDDEGAEEEQETAPEGEDVLVDVEEVFVVFGEQVGNGEPGDSSDDGEVDLE